MTETTTDKAPDKMSKSSQSSIYELTTFQAENLTNAANGISVAFAVLESLPTDDESRRQQFDRQNNDINDLLNLELVQDVSAKFTERIEVSRLNNQGRGFRVVALTESGLRLFHNSKNRSVN